MMLVAARYVMPHFNVAVTASGGPAAKSTEAEGSKRLNESAPTTTLNDVAVGVTGAFAYRTPNPSPVSEKKTGLSPDEDEKKVALAAYYQAVECREYLRAKRAIPLVRIPEIHSAGQVEQVRQRLDELEEVVQRNHGQCDGAGLEEVDGQLFELSLQVGLQGNLGAQACFI